MEKRGEENISLFPIQGPNSERSISENSEFVKPELRETTGIPFQKHLNSGSVTEVTDSVKQVFFNKLWVSLWCLPSCWA